MPRKVRRKKGNPKAATPTYREEGVKSSRPDTKPALIALFLVILLIGSALYFTTMVDEKPAIEYGVDSELLTNNHNVEPGYDTDFVLIVKNTGSIADTFDIRVETNNGGFIISIEENYESIVLGKNGIKPVIINVKTSSSSIGQLHAYLEIRSQGDISQTSNVRLDVNTDYTFGNLSSVGNSVSVHYAGILANNARLFDASMESVWDSYKLSGHYSQLGDQPVTDNNRHIATLSANNIGCDSPSTHENCDGGRGMIPGFDAKMVGMYEGQSLAVRIPAKDAYGETGTSALTGEDLIFAIVMVSID